MRPKPERNVYMAKIRRYGKSVTPQAQRIKKMVGYGGQPDPTRTRHETGTAYNRGCRCDKCLQTNRDRCNRSRWVRIALRQKLKKVLPVDHGIYGTYTNWGCRCNVCKRKNTDKCKQYQSTLKG